jgi:hypothetical protein
MTWRSLIGRGRGHLSDVIQILQSDWAAIVGGSLLSEFCTVSAGCAEQAARWRAWDSSVVPSTALTALLQ